MVIGKNVPIPSLKIDLTFEANKFIAMTTEDARIEVNRRETNSLEGISLLEMFSAGTGR